MKITVICVGKIKEKFYRQAIEEYSKRLSGYANFEIIETADEKAPEGLSRAEEKRILDKEGDRIISKLKGGFTVALAIEGKAMTSEEFAGFIAKKTLEGISHFNFIIGGSLGLSSEVMKKADFSLSFSEMTFPHQLMRVILTEQIYRAFRIINNEPYHK